MTLVEDRRCTVFAALRGAMLGAIVGMASLSPSAHAEGGGYVALSDVDPATLMETFEVNVRALNFRGSPTIDEAPVSVVLEGEFLLKTGETFNQDEGITWLKVIRKDGLEGWVSARHVEAVKDAVDRVEGAAAFLAGLNPAETQALAAIDDIKAGFIYPGPIGDAGWAFSHDAGRQALEQLPFVSKTSYIESVPDDPELVAAALEDLVAEGNNLIFAASYGYMDPMIEVAKRHPDVVFMHNSGFKTEQNAGTYFGRIYQARYLSGIIAGAMTKSNQIGYIAAFPIPEVIRGINAFTLAMRKINPDAEVKVVWVNTWYDPGKEADAAKTLIDQGADIITQHTDSPAPLQVAEERGAYAFGQASDMASFAPKAQLTSIIDNWDAYYVERAKAVIDGTWESSDVWLGIKEGMVEMADYGEAVPADVAAAADAIEAGIVDGSLHPFAGPINNQAGEQVVAEGETIGDGDLLKMDWYVEGVQGTIPK